MTAARSPLRLIPRPPPPGEGPPVIRPEVKITSTSRAENVDALDAAFHAIPGAYQRSMRLVQIIRSRQPKLLPAGTPVIRDLNAHSLGTLIDRHMQCMKFHGKAGEWRPCSVPADVAILPLLHQGMWANARPITAVVESPFFRPDGTIWQTAGYDEGTGYLYQPNATFPLVPENPSQADARTALESLRHVFHDFPYTTDAGRMVPIACLLTILARAAIAGPVPCFAFEASIQGSGKTKQGDCVAIIATGREPPHSNWPENEDEQGKRALSMALSGAPIYFLDNIKGLFGGAVLEGLMTTGVLRQRLLGGNEDAVVPWIAVPVVTGNNMRPTGDMARRMLLSRIEPDVEDPTRGRTFLHHPLVPWVYEQRERLVVAALTILRAYALKGYPDAGTGTLESFDEWARIVPGAIVFAGGANVNEAVGNAGDAGTDEAAGVAIFIRELPRLSSGPISAKAILSALYPGGHAPKPGDEPDGWDAMREGLEALAPGRHGAPPTSQALGEALGAVEGQVSAGSRLRRRKVHGHVWGWYVEPVKRS